MPKSGTLYVKGMTLTESEASASEGNMWDDTKLIEAYEKAFRIANSEVGEMSTNNRDKKRKIKSNRTSASNAHNRKEEVQWAAGMPCRAIYEDGLEYEAFLLKIIDEKECVVRFVGYNNSEIVPIRSLKRSLGKEERRLQIDSACTENIDSTSYRSETPNLEGMAIGSDQNSSTGNTEKQKPKKKRSSRYNRNNPRIPGFNLPQMPFAMPNLDSMRHLGSSDFPLPPPPPMHFPPTEPLDSEDEAVSSMLLSWYMSGYYTGLYQGLKRARRSSRNE